MTSDIDLIALADRINALPVSAQQELIRRHCTNFDWLNAETPIVIWQPDYDPEKAVWLNKAAQAIYSKVTLSHLMPYIKFMCRVSWHGRPGIAAELSLA